MDLTTRESAPETSARAASPGLLLQHVRLGRARTRKDLAEQTGLARSTVAQRIGLLARAGLLTEEEGAESSGGRPPLLLQFNPGAGTLLAANLSTSRCHAMLARLDGSPLATRVSGIAVAEGPAAVLGHVGREFLELLREAGESRQRVAGIGLGIPGPIEFATGRLVRPPAMPGWDGVAVPDHFREFQVPVVVDNDVHVMALGERECHYAEVDTLVFVKVDSGIGSGIVWRGEVFRGADGAAGGIGHIQLDRYADVPCGCGNRGCLAAVASGTALAAKLNEAGVPIRSMDALVHQVALGHSLAIQLVRDAGRDIGHIVAGAVNLLNPSVVVIGGALALTDEVLLAGVREAIYRRAPPLATRRLQIEPSRLGEDAGVIGAALLAARRVLSPAAIDAGVGWRL